MIEVLEKQLRSALARQQRWNNLRDHMVYAHLATWEYVAQLNQAEILYLRRLIDSEARHKNEIERTTELVA